MPLLRYTEFAGTSAADAVSGRSGGVYFGLQGNDSFTIAPHSMFTTFMGGGGADTYVAAANSTMTVFETGQSAGDRIVAAGVGFNYASSFAATIEGRHLFFFDLESGQSALVIDWHSPANRIESFALADGTFTYEFVSAVLPGAPHFLGNFSWDASGLAPGFSAADINEAISFYGARAAQSEAPPTLPEWGGSERADQGDGTVWDDIMRGLDGDDTLRGVQGNDVIYGNLGRDQLDGSSGNDTLYGGRGDDLVMGASGDDVIYGNMDHDSLLGEEGDDRLFGGTGDDSLAGAGGADRLAGNLGNDVLSGGAGADRFVLQSGAGRDVAQDFSFAAGDRIEVRTGTAVSVQRAPDGWAELTLDDGASIRLLGVPPASVSQAFLVFA
ncbi:MAG: calcium-binding protein [Alphaproteobacteria bacterium]|nr:calcium-binding protein [Alphaproteobacteria bacterium]